MLLWQELEWMPISGWNWFVEWSKEGVLRGNSIKCDLSQWRSCCNEMLEHPQHVPCHGIAMSWRNQLPGHSWIAWDQSEGQWMDETAGNATSGISSHRALQSLLCIPDNPHHPCSAGTTCRVELKNIWGYRNTVWWFLNYFKIVNKSRGGVIAAVCEGREMKQAWGKLAALMVFVLKFMAFFHGFSAP